MRSNWPGDNSQSKATGKQLVCGDQEVVTQVWHAISMGHLTIFMWKRLLSRHVDTFWSDQIKSGALLYFNMNYLHTDNNFPRRKQPCLQQVSRTRAMPRISVEAKILMGIYILQVNRIVFNQNEFSLLCLL